jgi:hypothetical protein
MAEAYLHSVTCTTMWKGLTVLGVECPSRILATLLIRRLLCQNFLFHIFTALVGRRQSYN